MTKHKFTQAQATIIAATIGLVGTIIAGFFYIKAATRPIELTINATETAKASEIIISPNFYIDYIVNTYCQTSTSDYKLKLFNQQKFLIANTSEARLSLLNANFILHDLTYKVRLYEGETEYSPPIEIESKETKEFILVAIKTMDYDDFNLLSTEANNWKNTEEYGSWNFEFSNGKKYY